MNIQNKIDESFINVVELIKKYNNQLSRDDIYQIRYLAGNFSFITKHNFLLYIDENDLYNKKININYNFYKGNTLIQRLFKNYKSNITEYNKIKRYIYFEIDYYANFLSFEYDYENTLNDLLKISFYIESQLFKSKT